MPKIKVRFKNKIKKSPKIVLTEEDFKNGLLLQDKLLGLESSKKPNIEEVIFAFNAFTMRHRAIKIACMREPSKWGKEYDTIYKNLFSALVQLGLAKHIDWNKKCQKSISAGQTPEKTLSMR